MHIESHDGRGHGMKLQQVSDFSGGAYGRVGSPHSTHSWPADPKFGTTHTGATRKSFCMGMSEAGGVNLLVDA